MGVTIHYSFVREQLAEDLLKKAEVLAKKLGFTIEERAWNKLIINPHPDSEWISRGLSRLLRANSGKFSGIEWI